MKSIIVYCFRISILLLICIGNIAAQWSADFATSDLSVWSGDIDVFIVNDDNQLQLNAPSAGESTIFRDSQISSDTVSLELYHTMDFAPSDNNKSTIYLTLDNIDLSSASGYYLEIGENGSDDGLKFYYINNGSSELIGAATMGAMSSEPAVVRLQIDIYPDGLWSVKTDYDGQEFVSLDVEFVDDRFKFKDGSFFGITCKYSASRADKFFYDDIVLKQFETDKTAPNIVNIEVLDGNQVIVTYDEPVEMSDAMNVNNYQIDNGIGNPITISNTNNLGNEYLLNFSEDFVSGIDYALSISDINDLNENTLNSFTYSFAIPRQPIEGDLLISEILFDPYTGGEDFIEIYNNTSGLVDLEGMTISNTQNEQTKTISESLTLEANEYIALTEDVDFLIQEYKPDVDANIFFTDLPAFNNDEGNITISNSEGLVLDSFDYSDDLHFQLIDDTEGVSLERVSFSIETNDLRNWQSASQNARFATPGYENSNSIVLDPTSDMFSIVNESFSPNLDGVDDQMILNYNLDKSGYLANISVHDAAGYKIKNLSQNELLSAAGIITWDGTNSEGNISNLGIYIIVGKLFHEDGEVIEFKKTTVLAGFID